MASLGCGADETAELHRIKPRVRVKAGRRRIGMLEYIVLGQQWRPGEIMWLQRGTDPAAVVFNKRG